MHVYDVNRECTSTSEPVKKLLGMTSATMHTRDIVWNYHTTYNICSTVRQVDDYVVCFRFTKSLGKCFQFSMTGHKALVETSQKYALFNKKHNCNDQHVVQCHFDAAIASNHASTPENAQPYLSLLVTE